MSERCLSYCDCCWALEQKKVPAMHLMEWGEELCSECMGQAVEEAELVPLADRGSARE